MRNFVRYRESKNFVLQISKVLIGFVAIMLGAAAVPARATQNIIHSFAGGTSDGANPYAGLAEDSSGNFYGAAFAGGSAGAGVLFKVSSGTYGLLYNFPGGAGTINGSGPTATPTLYPSTSPTIYGTTEYSTYSTTGGNTGGGVIYSISTGGVGYSVLHTLNGTTDGANPWSGVTVDSGGTYLYGTAPYGGAKGDGVFLSTDDFDQSIQCRASLCGRKFRWKYALWRSNF